MLGGTGLNACPPTLMLGTPGRLYLIPGRICDVFIGVWRPQIKTTVYIIKKMLASAPQIIGYCQHCTPSLKLYF